MIRRKSSIVVSYILLGIVLIVFLFPLYWALNTALKPYRDFFLDPPLFWPVTFTLKNFIDGYVLGGGKAVVDSTIVAVGTTLLSLILGVTAAYSIARWKTGGSAMPYYILSMKMMPPVVIAVAYYIVLKRSFLVYPPFDTHILLILLYSLINTPFVVWIMKDFIAEIPVSMEEAALLAGVSRLRIFVDIILPLARPGLIATAIISFMYSWHEFIFTIFFTSMKVRTIPKLVPYLVTEKEPLWGAINAVGFYGIIPMLIIGFVLQKHLIKGLSYGALKG
ncbi:MAG: carbohydrate ABC transporter permease [Spirochaetota bacterium]|nr:MAG: carbohydrate ABC transporter permease [Spirochaetota bacterium]